MASAQPPVVLRDLHKSYRRGSCEAPVLRGVSLSVEHGECVFLAGPSGSGKTTLLSILGCILSADQGLVQILGHDLNRLNTAHRAALRRHEIGFLFQRFHLIRGLSASENVAVPLTLTGIRPAVARARAAELLDAVGLSEHLRSDPRQMSVGQCQRVALARALAGDPQLILADEPTASLDAQNGEAIVQLLRRLVSEQGKTAVVVTHDQRIFDYADRILHLENGTVIAEHAPSRPQHRPPARPGNTLVRSASN